MPHFSRRDSDHRPPARPAAAGEFVAPAGSFRPRGSFDGPRDPKPRPSFAVIEPAGGEGGDETAAPLSGSRSAPARHDELKLCGLAAVKARFARDPGSFKRLFFDHAMGQRVGVICKALAQEKKVYRQVEPAELEKIAGSIHHGGIVAVVYAPPLRPPTAGDIREWVKRGDALLVLDRIGNAHNLGAIARTAAFFGVPRIVIPDHANAARPSDSAHRVAEGGFEHLDVLLAKDLVGFARELVVAGYEVVGAATRGAASLRSGERKADKSERKPVALFLGNEEHGLSPDLIAVCSRLVTIPGSGKVESLNVSVAASVLIWELLARNPGGAPSVSAGAAAKPSR
jgi:TrmH RNA methyltransferase